MRQQKASCSSKEGRGRGIWGGKAGKRHEIDIIATSVGLPPSGSVCNVRMKMQHKWKAPLFDTRYTFRRYTSLLLGGIPLNMRYTSDWILLLPIMKTQTCYTCSLGECSSFLLTLLSLTEKLWWRKGRLPRPPRNANFQSLLFSLRTKQQRDLDAAMPLVCISDEGRKWGCPTRDAVNLSSSIMSFRSPMSNECLGKKYKFPGVSG